MEGFDFSTGFVILLFLLCPVSISNAATRASDRTSPSATTLISSAFRCFLKFSRSCLNHLCPVGRLNERRCQIRIRLVYEARCWLCADRELETRQYAL